MKLSDSVLESITDECKLIVDIATIDPRSDWPAWRWPMIRVFWALGFLVTGMPPSYISKKRADPVLGYDASNVANIQAPIFEAFGHIELLSWVTLGYTALNVACVPLVSKLTSVFNLRIQVPLYTILIILGPILSASAHSINTVIVGSCITGIGGAGLYQT